ncbi:ABC transporter substrate-binding protein [Spirochaetia bacterium]|nr:ABC transporter substrate-binding protein [Spirochaetia bacterium]
MITKFKMLIVLLFAASQVFAGGSQDKNRPTVNADGTEAPVKIRLAVQPDHVQPFVAQKLGYFAEEGLDVELSVFSYGPPIIEALTSKSVDIGLVGDQPTYAAIANSIPIKIIGAYTTSDTYNGLIVRSNSNIKTLADLKGKKVAVAFGSNVQPLLYLYLERAGLSDTDVEIINLSLTDSTAALLAGRIDAAASSEPYMAQAVLSGGAVQIATSEGFKLFVSVIIGRDDFLKAYPQQTAKLLKVIQKAGLWSQDHQNEAAKILAEATDGNVEALKFNISKRLWDTALPQSRIDALTQGAGQSFKFGLITQQVDVAANIDTSYLKAAGIQ